MMVCSNKINCLAILSMYFRFPTSVNILFLILISVQCLCMYVFEYIIFASIFYICSQNFISGAFPASYGLLN